MPTVNLSLGTRSYSVHVENNSLDSVGYLTGRLRLNGKAAVISDSNVYPLYGERVIQSFLISLIFLSLCFYKLA